MHFRGSPDWEVVIANLKNLCNLARESEAACASGVRESVTPPLHQSVTPFPAAREGEASISEAAATVHEASDESGRSSHIHYTQFA